MPTICCFHKKENLPPPPVVMDNFWIANGNNYLKGCCGNPDHPIKMPDCFIINALQNIGRARADFDRLYPALLPCEQERFKDLMNQYPGLFKKNKFYLVESDERMKHWVTSIPVHTAGPNGGHPNPIICNQPMVQYVTG